MASWPSPKAIVGFYFFLFLLLDIPMCRQTIQKLEISSSKGVQYKGTHCDPAYLQKSWWSCLPLDYFTKQGIQLPLKCSLARGKIGTIEEDLWILLRVVLYCLQLRKRMHLLVFYKRNRYALSIRVILGVEICFLYQLPNAQLWSLISFVQIVFPFLSQTSSKSH